MRQSNARNAATLVELLMGILLSTIVIVLALTHIARHQRAYSDVVSVLDLRARLRDGSDIIAADLRGSSPTGDTVLVALDTAIEFYSTVGVSMLCSAVALNRISLPPDTLPSGRTLSSWLSAPDTGDYAAIYSDSTATSTRGWRRARVISVASVLTSGTCPAAAGLLSAGDAASPNRSYELTLAPTNPITARRGAPVRIVRRVRYSVYRGGDGKWYLGYRRCTAACAAIQPVSGPYQSALGAPMSFLYFSRSGMRLTGHVPTVDVGRVEIVSRARYSEPLRFPGVATPIVGDSATISITLRNEW